MALVFFFFDDSVLELFKSIPDSRVTLIRIYSQSHDCDLRTLTQAVSKISTLEEIFIWDFPLVNLDSKCELSNLKKLTIIKINDSSIDETGIQWLMAQPKLSELRLPFCPKNLIDQKPNFSVIDQYNDTVYWDPQRTKTTEPTQ